MKILILSPLFPPDTGAPADYVKELATRLARTHDTNLLIYGYLPEAVPGVHITSVDKRTLLPFRLMTFTKSLFRLGTTPDLFLVNNAPSVELPLLFFRLFKTVPYILLISDPVAEKASHRGLYKILHQLMRKQAQKIIVIGEESLYKKAELLPFTAFNAANEARRETWWNSHSKEITL